MNKFDKDNQHSIANFILRNLSTHHLLALATINQSSEPWVVCVNLSYDKELNIIWKSAKSSTHSNNIEKNNHVSICVFSHSQEQGSFGFYCKAIAHEITDEVELQSAIACKYVAKGLDSQPIENFLGSSPNRLYSAKLTEAWVVDDRHLKVSVDLNELRKAVKLTL